MADDALIDWLLEGDPAIRWRVLAGPTGAARERVERERALVG